MECIQERMTQQEYNKMYHQKHKEEKIEKLGQKVKCECGCEVAKWNYSRHKKSRVHQQGMEIINLKNKILSQKLA